MPNSLHRFKADIFQALSHPTRVAIVEQLREDELTAGELINRLGLEQANASQHLAVLRSKNIVLTRRKGNFICYKIRDKSLLEVLDALKGYLTEHVIHTSEWINEAVEEDRSLSSHDTPSEHCTPT